MGKAIKEAFFLFEKYECVLARISYTCFSTSACNGIENIGKMSSPTFSL